MPNSPVSTRLPFEILREIVLFAYVYIPEPYEPKDEHELDLQVVSPPITASHVCRSWRYHLLSDSTLWTCILIPQIKPNGIMELLRRSERSPSLNIFILLRDNRALNSDDTPNIFHPLFENIRRFETLHVVVNATDDDYLSRPNSPDYLQSYTTQILSLIQQPAPKLKTFRFWYENPRHPLQETYLDTLFSGEALNLERLQHRFSDDFRELSCPLFHNLSELYITIVQTVLQTVVDFGRFLDLIELSPNLELLWFYGDWASQVDISSEFPPSREVQLPFLKRLMLDVSHVIEFRDLLLSHVVVPGDIKWWISTRQSIYLYYQDEHFSQAFLDLLPTTRFTSLQIQFRVRDESLVSVAFEEEHRGPVYLNQFEHKKLVYLYDNIYDLMELWDPLMLHLEPSCHVTHLYLEFEASLEYWKIFPKIFGSMWNLEYLTIKQNPTLYPPPSPHTDDVDPYLGCLSALIPSPEKLAAWEYKGYNTNTKNVTDEISILDSDLDSIDSDSDDSDSTNQSDYVPSLTLTIAFPCLFLKELAIELKFLTKAHASVLLVCYKRRREEGYPLRIIVRCEEMEEGVEHILPQTGDADDTIHVSIVSFTWN